ncbi:hypothetical protein R3Q06_08900 [Rhodococcus erythropolis]|uniref:hypothetical protein n=1 Tax=Rhodococcus erythropolis TaxID=1833 RepID=UPI0029498618|nr:hypothetical protein [Rhodococcus erythropolis]MDV6273615.1 hypothetical protein [Rhodococcus erythropolis]
MTDTPHLRGYDEPSRVRWGDIQIGLVVEGIAAEVLCDAFGRYGYVIGGRC